MNSWSFTKLLNFEKCPHMVTFPYRAIDNEHTLRGTEVHNTIEQAIKNKTPCEYDTNFPIKQVAMLPNYTEPKWGFDKDWKVTEYYDAWCKLKPDLVYIQADTLTVVDYKTGKKDGNELKHRQQLQLYAIGAAIMEPDVPFIRSELWYTDIATIEPVITAGVAPNRASILSKAPRWKERALKMTEATEFPAKPNKSNCRFCWENDRCEFAVLS